MSKTASPSETDLSDLSNEELLGRVAELDEEQYPIAEHARRALGGQEEDSS